MAMNQVVVYFDREEDGALFTVFTVGASSIMSAEGDASQQGRRRHSVGDFERESNQDLQLSEHHLKGGPKNMIRKATLKIGVPIFLVCMALNAILVVDHLPNAEAGCPNARKLRDAGEHFLSSGGFDRDGNKPRGYLLTVTDRTCNRTPLRKTKSESILRTSRLILLLVRRANNQWSRS